MSNLVLCAMLLSQSMIPQNPLLEHYTLIPPLGVIKSIAASPTSVYVISDDYLIVFDKPTLTVDKTLHFDEEIYLLAYDRLYNELWIKGSSHVFRLNMASFNVRGYPFEETTNRIGIESDYVYLGGTHLYALSKRSGSIEQTNNAPGNVEWYRTTTIDDVRKYPYLTPYSYFDEPTMSDVPLRQFPITALYNDGMFLYVGTAGYGLLEYNTSSWLKRRTVYGPLDSRVQQVKEYNDTFYFLSAGGISYFRAESLVWRYHRAGHNLVDMTYSNDGIIVSFGTRLSQDKGDVYVAISTMDADVLTLGRDQQYLYIGTASGLFRMYHGTGKPSVFGPEAHSVYAVYPMEDYVFVGGEYALYKYERKHTHWTEILPFGVKDITRLNDDLYLLGVNNQLIKYNYQGDTMVSDEFQPWVLLPYFNVYDIDADSAVVYCASYAGIYYYEPMTNSYRVIYNLPRTSYTHVFVAGDMLYAVSDRNLYSLPLRYRD